MVLRGGAKVFRPSSLDAGQCGLAQAIDGVQERGNRKRVVQFSRGCYCLKYIDDLYPYRQLVTSHGNLVILVATRWRGIVESVVVKST